MTWNPLLTQNAVVLFGIEETPNEAATLSPATDAVLVMNPAYTTSPQVIDRNFSKRDMSHFEFRIGRIEGKTTFTCEVRGNMLQQSGVLTDAPMLARLFRACGMQLQAATTAAQRVGPVFPRNGNIGEMTFVVKADAPTLTQPAMYTLTCTTAGAGAAALVSIQCNNPGVYDEVTTAVPCDADILLPGSGASITPTVSSNLAVGDVWQVLVMPQGIKAVPISTDFETATIELFFDGLHHKMTGSVGTFQIKGDAGGVVTVDFDFSGVHTPVDDQALPDGIYDEILPPLFEDALMTWGETAELVLGSFSFDMAGTNVARDDANSPQGYRGYSYTGRTPAGGFDAEATLEANAPFWGDFEAAQSKYFMARVGQEIGNSFLVEAPRAQTSALPYADKNNNRIYNLTMKFARYQGDDEVRFFFY